jgi:C1A family cysteine protease
MDKIVRKYGWRRDLPSQIPWFDHNKLRVGINPPVVDNSSYIKFCYDQGQEGSCTANSGLGSNRFFRSVTGMPDFDGSRQFLYYVTRAGEGTQDSDSGASIADTVTAEATVGICLESTWAYTNDLTVKPSDQAYSEAKLHQVLAKSPVEQTQDALETVLASKRPLHYGMTVYQSFENASNGVVPMPGFFEQPLGGHALFLHSYDRNKKLFYGQNSWGTEWGYGGLCLFSIPYDYILSSDYASDFWTIAGVT